MNTPKSTTSNQRLCLLRAFTMDCTTPTTPKAHTYLQATRQSYGTQTSGRQHTSSTTQVQRHKFNDTSSTTQVQRTVPRVARLGHKHVILQEGGRPSRLPIIERSHTWARRVRRARRLRRAQTHSTRKKCFWNPSQVWHSPHDT